MSDLLGSLHRENQKQICELPDRQPIGSKIKKNIGGTRGRMLQMALFCHLNRISPLLDQVTQMDQLNFLKCRPRAAKALENGSN
ncbi:hypothetical protein HanPI659440_Chr03g0119971 [Helianthus annuus]|nr:hypothetical protein HanPI659440_Chr03g0119971 [Helianthus annuus]